MAIWHSQKRFQRLTKFDDDNYADRYFAIVQEAAQMQLDGTMNDRVANDLHVNTREERKASEIIDVSRPFFKQ